MTTSDIIVPTQILGRMDKLQNEGERIFREAQCPVLVVKGEERIRALYDGVE